MTEPHGKVLEKVPDLEDKVASSWKEQMMDEHKRKTPHTSALTEFNVGRKCQTEDFFFRVCKYLYFLPTFSGDSKLL